MQKDLYRNPVRLEVFEQALINSKALVCYNGDIHSKTDYKNFTEKFPQIDTVMLGRGIFKNPGLVGEISGKERVRADKIQAFHDDILVGYEEIMSGDRNTLFKMKEIWSYLSEFFEGSEKYLKKIKKANSANTTRLTWRLRTRTSAAPRKHWN